MTRKKNGPHVRALAALCLLFVISPVGAQMSMAGDFQVDESGASNYSIPLTLPPGVSGVQPSLAFNYNSQTSVGDLGIGWSLSGLPEITRCSRTATQDGGFPGTIGFDSNDRFCLNGQRLILRSGGTYGASGAEYRTERETFSKIVSYGTAGSGPQYFKVWTKAGEVIEYGNTADSRIEALGITSVRAWALNKLSDNNNNYLTVSYIKDTVNGAYVADEIKYTGNSSTAQLPNASVKFVYEARIDPVAQYMGGKLIKQVQRLSKVQTFVAASKIREYTLTYELSPVTYRSRITQVQECAGSLCLPSTVFTWQTQTEKTVVDNLTQTSSSITWGRPFRIWTMDTNNDGIMDLAAGGASVESGGENIFHIHHADRWDDTWVAAGPWGDMGKTVVGDFNGDNLTDIASPTAGTAYMRLTNFDASGLSSQIWTLANTWGAENLIRTGDFNGDGLTDIASPSGTHVYMKLSNGGGFDSQDWTVSGQWGGAGTTFVGDFNGDGLSDIASASGVNIYVNLSTGTGFAPTQNWIVSNQWGSDAVTWAADFNGDGLTDIASASGGNIYMKLSTGKSFDYQTWTVDPTWGSAANTFVGDFNGDGLPDIASASGSNIYMKFSTGTRFEPKVWTTASGWGDPSYTKVGDFNGDGLADFISGVFISAGYGNNTQYKFTQPGLDLIASISNGLGSITTIDYDVLSTRWTDDYLASNQTYTMDPPGSSSDQKREVIGPLYVVKKVSASNGIDGTLTTSHRYWGLKTGIGLNGRGSRGFRQIVTRQLETLNAVTTTYSQTWPYTGLPTRVTTRGRDVIYTYNCKLSGTSGSCPSLPVPGSVYDVYKSQSIEKNTDGVTGAVLPILTTTSVFDGCGNTTSATTTTGDGYSKTLANTYTGVSSADCSLSRLSSSSVTTTAP